MGRRLRRPRPTAYHLPHGAIAQLEERVPCTDEVAGSSPAGSTSPRSGWGLRVPEAGRSLLRMGGARRFAVPQVRDYGTLVAMAGDGGLLTHVGIGGSMAVVTAPAVLGESGGGTTPGEDDGVAGEDLAASPGGGGGPAGGAAGESGTLPFTGYAAGLLAAIGAGLAGAGHRARRALRRR
jgi:hypothetical protein